MSSGGSQWQQQQQLTAEERAIAEYFADAECARKRPNNPAAYRATILARKCSELIAARALTAARRVTLLTDEVVVTDTAEEPFVPVDPLIAAQRWREGREASRCEQPELLARLRAEQARDHSWR